MNKKKTKKIRERKCGIEVRMADAKMTNFSATGVIERNLRSCDRY